MYLDDLQPWSVKLSVKNLYSDLVRVQDYMPPPHLHVALVSKYFPPVGNQLNPIPSIPLSLIE